MNKTSPIGVRFDSDLLKVFSDNDIEITPQKALVFYERLFKKQLEEGLSISDKKEIKIYKLINPIDNTVFYVGRTSFDLNFRLGGHLTQVNYKGTGESLNQRKIEILKSILVAGKKPIIELLEAVLPISENEYRGYHEREIYWMIHFLESGEPLTNKISDIMIDRFKNGSVYRGFAKGDTKVIGIGGFDEQLDKTNAGFKKPETLAQLKTLCPIELTGFEKSQWIATERQKYGI